MSESVPRLRWMFIFLILFPASLIVPAQVMQEDGKSLTRSFTVREDVELDIESKYGVIRIETWDQPRAEFLISIRVKALQRKAVDALLEKVFFNLDGDGKKIVLRSGINQIRRWTTSALTDPAETEVQFEDGEKYRFSEIDFSYTIKIPSRSSLKIAHRFGDIHLDQHQGTADIRLKYGQFHAGDIQGNLGLDLEYSKATISSVNKGTGKLHYGNVWINNTSRLKFESSNSVVNVEAADTLILGNRYNQYELGKVSSLIAEEENSELEIEHLMQWGDIHSRYGSINIQQLGKNFRKLNIDGTYTQVQVKTEPGSAYRFQLSSEKADLGFPSGLNLSEDVRRGQERKVIGTVNGGGKGLFQINVIAGEVDVR